MKKIDLKQKIRFDKQWMDKQASKTFNRLAYFDYKVDIIYHKWKPVDRLVARQRYGTPMQIQRQIERQVLKYYKGDKA